MDRIVYRAMVAGKNFLVKAYYILIMFLIAASVFEGILEYIDYIPLIRMVLLVFIWTELIGTLFYFSLGFIIRITENQIGLEGSLGGTEMWQIVRSWKFFKDDILKESLIMNGFAVTVCTILLNWVVLV